MLLTLDFGGTKLSAATRDPDSFDRIRLERVYTPADATADHEIEQMLALADTLLAGSPPTAIGVSFGGPVDAARGLVLKSDTVPGWEERPLREQLSAHFNAPVAIDNDANLGRWENGASGPARASTA